MFFSKFFKKKPKPAPLPAVIANLPALNAWGILFQGQGFTLYSRSAATVPGGNHSELVYLKSYPEVSGLERRLFAEWFTTTSTGIYLKQWEDSDISWSLVCVTFLEPALSIIKTGIKSADWASGYEDGKPTIVVKGEATVILE
jgi:hypothetical protein